MRISLAGERIGEISAIAAHAMQRNQNLEWLATVVASRRANVHVQDLGRPGSSQRGNRGPWCGERPRAAWCKNGQRCDGNQDAQERNKLAMHCS
jgi:hypothetical protein